jgi:hypothetical protein
VRTAPTVVEGFLVIGQSREKSAASDWQTALRNQTTVRARIIQYKKGTETQSKAAW